MILYLIPLLAINDYRYFARTMEEDDKLVLRGSVWFCNEFFDLYKEKYSVKRVLDFFQNKMNVPSEKLKYLFVKSLHDYLQNGKMEKSSCFVEDLVFSCSEALRLIFINLPLNCLIIDREIYCIMSELAECTDEAIYLDCLPELNKRKVEAFMKKFREFITSIQN